MVGYQLSTLLSLLGEDERHALQREWKVSVNGATAPLEARMSDEGELRARFALLPELSRDILRRVLERDDACVPYRDLVQARAARAAIEVEREVQALERSGLLFRVEDNRVERLDEPLLAVPHEVAELFARWVGDGNQEDETSRGREREGGSGLKDAPPCAWIPVLSEPAALTLKGWLEERHFAKPAAGPDGGADRAKQHARQAYKLFLQPVAIEKRIGRLAPELRELVDVATRRFGGFLPRSAWVATHGDAELFDQEDTAKVLGDALLGRFVRFDLARYGIHGDDVCFVVFQDVTLVRLREHAARHNVLPADEHVAGVDLATNLMRYLRYVDENGVRFTVRGEIFQATKKRMVSQLVAEEASADDVDAVFDFVDRFARKRHLIDATGERTLRLSEAGRGFEAQGLEDKLRDLLAFAIEDVHGSGGDPFHQKRLRRIVVRLLRRLEPERWYDAMHVPFLARNAYVAQMDELGVREHFDRERREGRFVMREDLKKLAWHLFDWLRRRLHPLGIVDLGFDQGHPVALRLSRIGATLLQGSPAQAAEGARSTLVVNPDFEVLLFPDSDVWPLVHKLDRFAKRLSSDRLYRFLLCEESLRSALADGMGLGQILEVLTLRCRTPLPQNVRFNLEDWAARAGALRLTNGGRILATKSEVLHRVLAHKRVREVCVGDEDDLRLGPSMGAVEFRSLLRDLGYFLELPATDDEAARSSSEGENTDEGDAGGASKHG